MGYVGGRWSQHVEVLCCKNSSNTLPRRLPEASNHQAVVVKSCLALGNLLMLRPRNGPRFDKQSGESLAQSRSRYLGSTTTLKEADACERKAAV